MYDYLLIIYDDQLTVPIYIHINIYICRELRNVMPTYRYRHLPEM